MSSSAKNPQEKTPFDPATQGGDQAKVAPPNETPIVLSGIRPTGDIHLGNYFGAIKNFIALQEENKKRLYFVADLHALTTAMEDKPDIDAASIDVIRWYLACGVDPAKSLIYRQSDILEIPMFNLLLGMIAPEGEVRRCTTYKEKSADMEDKHKLVSVGLLAYPVLMAADILFCNADVVPVGEDQLQHLEIAREIARRYNHYYGDKHLFVEPQSQSVQAIRVPGLKGEGKMSKSVGGVDNVIYLSDTPKQIKKKVMAAQTDTGPVAGEPMSQPMQNIYQLLKLCASDAVYEEYLEKYNNCEQKYYGYLKQALAEAMTDMIAPIQARYHSAECSEERVREILAASAKEVRAIAQKNLANMLDDMKFADLAKQYRGF